MGQAVPFHVARDPVNLPALRRWCDAMGSTNLVQTDPLVAPLSMLDVWTKPGLAYTRDVTDPQGGAFEALDRDGFTSALVVSSQLVQARPLVLGDLVHSTMTLEDVSPEKSTALGPAHFVTTRQDFFVDDAVVGYARLTVMKFRPTGESRRPAAAPRGESAPASGEAMPPVRVPITATLIVAGALATSDYFEVHHDRDAAQRRGSRDILMNIHTSLGIVERCVSEWLGPGAVPRSIVAKLGVPNYPGDVMTVDAEVASRDPRTGETRLEYRATNGLGVHASGTIDVTLPR